MAKTIILRTTYYYVGVVDAILRKTTWNISSKFIKKNRVLANYLFPIISFGYLLNLYVIFILRDHSVYYDFVLFLFAYCSIII